MVSMVFLLLLLLWGKKNLNESSRHHEQHTHTQTGQSTQDK